MCSMRSAARSVSISWASNRDSPSTPSTGGPVTARPTRRQLVQGARSRSTPGQSPRASTTIRRWRARTCGSRTPPAREIGCGNRPIPKRVGRPGRAPRRPARRGAARSQRVGMTRRVEPVPNSQPSQRANAASSRTTLDSNSSRNARRAVASRQRSRGRPRSPRRSPSPRGRPPEAATTRPRSARPVSGQGPGDVPDRRQRRHVAVDQTLGREALDGGLRTALHQQLGGLVGDRPLLLGVASSTNSTSARTTSGDSPTSAATAVRWRQPLERPPPSAPGASRSAWPWRAHRTPVAAGCNASPVDSADLNHRTAPARASA